MTQWLLTLAILRLAQQVPSRRRWPVSAWALPLGLVKDVAVTTWVDKVHSGSCCFCGRAAAFCTKCLHIRPRNRIRDHIECSHPAGHTGQTQQNRSSLTNSMKMGSLPPCLWQRHAFHHADVPWNLLALSCGACNYRSHAERIATNMDLAAEQQEGMTTQCRNNMAALFHRIIQHRYQLFAPQGAQLTQRPATLPAPGCGRL